MLYAAISKAYVGTKSSKSNKRRIRITEVAVYMRDTYDFIGNQYLGHWNHDGLGINAAGGIANKLGIEWSLPGWNPSLGGAQSFGNADFRQYRTDTGKGSDLLLFSGAQRIKVNEVFEANF